MGGTQVTLDVLMEAYDQGATPEQIGQGDGDGWGRFACTNACTKLRQSWGKAVNP